MNTVWPLSESCVTDRSTFPPMSGRMCILPVWACFTDETMRQVPLSVTWRFDQRFTGSASFPFRTLNTPESCTRSEPPTLRGLPADTQNTLLLHDRTAMTFKIARFRWRLQTRWYFVNKVVSLSMSSSFRKRELCGYVSECVRQPVGWQREQSLMSDLLH